MTTNDGVPFLEMRGITKTFPGVRALDGVTFDLHRGEFHALVGENGAGKSTLMKILCGVYPYPDYGGEIRIEGETQRFRSVRDAEAARVAVIFQELSLVKEMTVGENIFLGREPRKFGIIRWDELYRRARQLLEDLHLRLDPRTPVKNLGIGQQQLVEIAKALSQEARLLVLDEPTAALTGAEVETLFGILNKLRARGVGMIYISHKLDEVFRMSDRITVLRDGRTVGTQATSALDEATVIAQMVGREVGDIFPQVDHAQGDVLFEARNISVEDPAVAGKKLIDRVGFSVRRGEVLGIAGLMGAGRSDLLMAIFGAHAGRVTGEVLIEGKPVLIRNPAEAIDHGLGFVTEDRKRFGLVLDQSILNNMTLAGLARISGRFITNVDAEAAAGNRSMKDLRVKANSVFTVAGTLSGGNQQKVVLAKWLLTNPRVLFLDEPTRGIDVGAKQEIYAQINALARQGLAIVLVSSELPEVLGLSDRVLVLHEGRLTGEFTRTTATPEKVMACATGMRGTSLKQQTARYLYRLPGIFAKFLMNQPANESAIDRPPVNADVTPAAGELTRQTRIGNFKIPTDALRAYTMLFALAVIWIFFNYATDGIFLEPRNFSNLMRQTAVTGVLAVGMLMVIVTGNIDLSIGSLVGFIGGVAAIAQGTNGWGLLPTIAAAIIVGIAVAEAQGALVAYANIPAFIVTLGGLLAWRGVVLGMTKGETIPITLPGFKAIGQQFVTRPVGLALALIAIAAIVWMNLRRHRAQQRYGLEKTSALNLALRIIVPALVVVLFILRMNAYEGMPIPVIILIIVALAGAFLTQNTTFGRYLYAIGGNPDAARLSGINVRNHIWAVFCIMGALAGVASLIYTARVGSASPDAGNLLELDAIAACVIGGTSLMGGRGTVFGACLGALFMASLDNGMSLLNVEPYTQYIIKGAILVTAVGLDMLGAAG
jgi:D-xylose transport system ATP-binding protein